MESTFYTRSINIRVLLLCRTLICIFVVACNSVYAFEDSEQTYLRSIKPLLEKHCFSCHGGLKQEAGLRLDTAELILKGSDSGPVIDLQNVGLSELVQRITATDESVMPPKHEGERLNEDQVKMIIDWLHAGPKIIPNEEPSIGPREHWAFQRIERPNFPLKHDSIQPANPIDRFLDSQNGEMDSSWENSSEDESRAPPITLLRRLSIDLRGLPVEDDIVASFVQRKSIENQGSSYPTVFDQVYDSMVDRWLADKAYGERWGRHWMDVWRYSDWWGLGEELRNSQLHMWHWRDWIVESLNENVPYDEMLRQMIAADELYPDDPKKLRATGFLARNFFLFNRNQWMEETVEHVGKGMLGLTLNCAKCHDHKYDPISQTDYYRFRAIFEPYHVRLDMIEGEADLRKNGLPRVFDRDLESPTYLFVRGEESKPDKSKPLVPGIPSFLTFGEYSPATVQLPRSAFQPDLRESTIRTYMAQSESRVAEIERKLQTSDAKIAGLEHKLLEFDKSPNNRSAMPNHQLHFAEDWGEKKDIEATKESWDLFGGDWSLADGRLHQISSIPDRSIARLKASAPNDFVSEMAFAINGGKQWKSVGISFDCTDIDPMDGQQQSDHEVSVYASAYEGEQKIQIAYLSEGQWVYPADAKVLQPIELGKINSLRLVVRDQLINVFWNDKFVLAWKLPFLRKPGAIQLTTFDAQACFDRFTLESLDESTSLRLPNGDPSYSDNTLAGVSAQLTDAKKQAELANLELAVAKEELSFHRARLANPETATRNQWALASASFQKAVAQQALDRADEKNRDQKIQELGKAQQFWERVSQGDHSEFQPVQPGAKWSATRFQFSGKDDPDKAFPEYSSGRRSALANWITSPDNPLTARVAINHIWTRHFGEPLVQDAFDLGMKSKRPAKLDLLNWLAAELIDHRWDMKHLHRIIVKSNYYKRQHRSVPRLESQAVRDSVFALAGKLDRTLGGPSIPASEQSTSNRRSLYLFHSNNERNLFLTMFDEALVTECYRRDESIVTQQALAMSHSRIVLENVPAIVQRIEKYAVGSPEQFIRIAFAWILGLEPTADELELCRAMLCEESGSVDLQVNNENELSFSRHEELVWVLLNHHHFLQVP